MLTVLIETLDSEKPLARTLAALVPAVVEGLLRRVTVIDRGSSDQTTLVATGAGCSLYESAQMQAALADIRTAWVLLLEPGAIPPDGWEEAARRHMENETGAARFGVAGEGGVFRKIFSRGPGLDAGLLVRLEAVQPFLSEGVAFGDLPRRFRPKRLTI